jgi:hypothetical protein
MNSWAIVGVFWAIMAISAVWEWPNLRLTYTRMQSVVMLVVVLIVLALWLFWGFRTAQEHPSWVNPDPYEAF